MRTGKQPCDPGEIYEHKADEGRTHTGRFAVIPIGKIHFRHDFCMMPGAGRPDIFIDVAGDLEQ